MNISRSRLSRHFGPSLVVALTALLALTLSHVPAAAQETDPEPVEVGECPTEDVSDLAASDEYGAYLLALACGVEVEVLDLRDVDRQAWATAEGTIRSETFAIPQWVETADGWVDVDTELVSDGDGGIRAAATVVDVAIGAGGDAPFVTATDPDGGTVALSWLDGDLPAPVVDGPVARFAEVRPGIDLEVQAEVQGFAWVLVVRSAEAAADPILDAVPVGIESEGLSVSESETGGLIASRVDGSVVFESGQAIMWDSATAAETESDEGIEAASPQNVAEVATRLTDSGLELTADEAMLADDATVYPVYVDPNFTSTRYSWANVFKGNASKGWTGDTSWPRSGGFRVGLNTWSDCGDGCGLWRGVITVNTGGLAGRYIKTAEVKMTQTHMGGCANRWLQLWRINKHENNVSWNGVTWLYGTQLQSVEVQSSNSTGSCSGSNPNRAITFNNGEVKKRVQSVADLRYTTMSFGLRSSNEDHRDAWRRISTGSFKLEVEYYVYPPKPDQLKVNNVACTSTLAAAKWTTSSFPTLSARVKTSESQSVNVRMRTRKSGASENYYWRITSTPVSASTQTHTVTTAHTDGNYYFEAWSEASQSASVNSGYTAPCYFKVDATKPTAPTITPGADGPYSVGDTVQLALGSTDPLVSGVASGIARFEYSWQTGTFDQQIASTGSATITRANLAAGRHVLYIRAIDNAGNRSDTRTYTFFAGGDIPATPMALWRFDGDAFDDTGHGHDLAPVSGSVSYEADRDGRPASALTLDGGTCLSTDDGDSDTEDFVVRTDAAFSVAAWLRVDSASGFTKAITRAGAEHSSFQLQYGADEDKWYFSLLSTPGSDFVWQSVGAPATAELGEWQHVAGTYDPDAGLMRIYVDGVLAGELAVDFTPWHQPYPTGIGCLLSGAGNTANHVTGAIDQVGIWAGLLTPEQVQASMLDLPGASEQARWEFRDGGTDSSAYGRDLAIPDGVTAGADPYNRPSGAVELDGSACLEYPGPIVATDRSFTVVGWARIDDPSGHGTIVSASGVDNTSFRLRYSATYERFEFAMFTADTPTGGGTTWLIASGAIEAESDQWFHVSGVFDAAANEMRLYLDGVLQQTRSGPEEPWTGAGPTRIGCAGATTGAKFDYWTGALHDVRLWRGAVTADQLPGLMGDPPAELAAWWGMDWEADDAALDASGNGHDLAFSGEVGWTDGWDWYFDSALAFDGAGYAATGGPVVSTDESFTVTAWARVDDLNASYTVAASSAVNNTGFRIRFSHTAQAWEFAMPAADTAAESGESWRNLTSTQTPVAGEWYHLTAVYSLAEGEMRFYVDGELQGTGSGPSSPWDAAGSMTVGAAQRTSDGHTWDHHHGAVDDVGVWRGALPENMIDALRA